MFLTALDRVSYDSPSHPAPRFALRPFNWRLSRVDDLLAKINLMKKNRVFQACLALSLGLSIADAKALELKNKFLSVKVDETTSLAEVTDLKTNTVYQQLPDFDVSKIKNVALAPQQNGVKISFVCDKLATSLTYTLAPDAPVLDVTLDMDPEQKIQMVNFPVPFTVCGKGFEWVMPDGYGMLYKVDSPAMPERCPKGIFQPCMEWAGLFHPQTGQGYTLINRDYYCGNFSLKLKPIADQPTLVPALSFGGYLGKFQEPRRVRFIFQPSGGYVNIALNFRKYLMESGQYRSLAQKEKENPMIAKLRGAPVFWIYPGATDAASVMKILDDMIASGMDKGIVGLGFNYFVGPEAIKEIQKKWNGPVGVYDNYFDLMDKEWWQANGYPKLAVDWMERYKRFGRIPEHVASNEKGQLRENPGKHGSRFVGSPSTTLEAAKERLDAEWPDYRFNYRFFDVTPGAALWLDQDFNPQHPATPKQSMEGRLSVFKLFYEHGMIIGGEGGAAWATPYFSVSEGAMSVYHMEGRLDPVPPTEDWKNFNMSPEKRVPTNGIVYGDARVATWAWGDNTLLQPDYILKKDLFNILYGTAPSYHVSNGTYWKNKEKILESYHRVVPVYTKLFGAALINHRWLTPDRSVQQTDFSNGWHVVVNFGATEYALDKQVTVAPMGFHTWQNAH